MKIIATILRTVVGAVLMTTTTTTHAMEMMDGEGFAAMGTATLMNTLTGNLEIIGAHLHTGSSDVNGPVAIIFCGGPQLPDILGINGLCDNLENQFSAGDMNSADWSSTTSKGAWDDGGNTATAAANATTLADGEATTYSTFMTALDECTSDMCDVYFNLHTNYSFSVNPGVGLARGQLFPTDCSDDKPDGMKCFGATVTSENTNAVPDVMPLAVGAGEVTPISGDVLVTYMGMDMDHDDSADPDPDPDPDTTTTTNGDSAASKYNLWFTGVTSVITATTFANWLLL